MMLLLVAIAALSFGFVAGSCWEACRRGGTLDLHIALHRATTPAEPSNVRVLPRQRTGGWQS